MGSKDDVVSNSAIEEMLETAASNRKEKLILEGVDHSIFMYKEALDAVVESQVQFLREVRENGKSIA